MIKKLIFAIILAIIGHRIYNLVPMLGFHVTVFNHTPGPCRLLPNIDHGAEDINLIPGDKALFTTGLRYFNRHQDSLQRVKTGVMLFDFNVPQKGATPVKIEGLAELDDSDFHGLSVLENRESGETEVYIVNHFDSYSVVERFVYNDNDNILYHKETLGKGDHSFHMLNDVIVTGPREFYVTNTLHTRNPLEVIAQVRWGSVVYFDGKQGHVVVDSLLTPNGINKSPDGRTVYVSAWFDRSILTFDRAGDNSLHLQQTTRIYTTPDNINVDPESGDLWVGVQAVGHQALQYPAVPCASKVLRLETDKGQITKITEVFSDDGSMFSGSSVGLYRKNHLFVGSIFSKALVCEVKYF